MYSWFGIKEWLNPEESLIRATTESLDEAQNWIYCQRGVAGAWYRRVSLPDCFDPKLDWKWIGSFVPRLQFGRHQLTVSGSFWLHIGFRVLVAEGICFVILIAIFIKNGTEDPKDILEILLTIFIISLGLSLTGFDFIFHFLTTFFAVYLNIFFTLVWMSLLLSLWVFLKKYEQI